MSRISNSSAYFTSSTNDQTLKTSVTEYYSNSVDTLEIDQSSANSYAIPLYAANMNNWKNPFGGLKLKIKTAGASGTNITINSLPGETGPQAAKRIIDALQMDKATQNQVPLLIWLFEPCGAGKITITSNVSPNIPTGLDLYENGDIGPMLLILTIADATPGSEQLGFILKEYDRVAPA